MRHHVVLAAGCAIAVSGVACANDVFTSIGDAAADDGGVLTDASGDAPDAAVACNDDLSTNPQSCGQCGHDCAGGACLAGVCQPTAFANVGAKSLAVLNGFLYWTGGSGIFRQPFNGAVAQREVLFKGSGTTGDLAIDGTDVYFSDTALGTIARCPITGCPNNTPTLIAQSLQDPRGIAVDDTYVYWATREGGAIQRATKLGADLKTLGTADTSLYVASDGNKVYYLHDCCEGVSIVPRTGGQAVVVGPSLHLPGGLVLDQDAIYASSFYDKRIARIALTGGPDLTVENVENAYGMAVDDKTAYWFAAPDVGQGVLYWANKNGFAADGKAPASLKQLNVPVVSHWSGEGMHMIITSDESVYWTGPDSILRMRK